MAEVLNPNFSLTAANANTTWTNRKLHCCESRKDHEWDQPPGFWLHWWKVHDPDYALLEAQLGAERKDVIAEQNEETQWSMELLEKEMQRKGGGVIHWDASPERVSQREGLKLARGRKVSPADEGAGLSSFPSSARSDTLRTAMSSNAIPPELLLHIFRCVADIDEKYGHYSRSLLRCLLVSRSWAECARLVLYEAVDIWWTSKRGASFVSATNGDLNPNQSQMLCVTFPRITDWPQMENLEGCMEEEAWESFELDMSWEEHRAMLENVEAAKDRFYASLPEGFAQAAAIEAARKEARDEGEAGWMDGGPEGEAPRREGARELFRLVRRLPALRHLELVNVDWITDGGDGPNPMDELPSLNSLVDLSVRGGENTALILPALLTRTPNIDRLSIDPCDEAPIPSLFSAPLVNFTLPNLTSIHSRQLGLVVASIITLAASTLQTIRLSLSARDVSLEHALTFLLPQVVYLDEFSLWIESDDSPSSSQDDDLTSPFRAFFARSTIRHLVLPCPPSHILLKSLPPSTISIKIHWPVTSKLASWIVDLLQQVLEEKRSRLNALARFKVVGPSCEYGNDGEKERGLSGEEWELVQEARNEGLEIIFGDRERMRVEVMFET